MALNISKAHGDTVTTAVHNAKVYYKTNFRKRDLTIYIDGQKH